MRQADRTRGRCQASSVGCWPMAQMKPVSSRATAMTIFWGVFPRRASEVYL